VNVNEIERGPCPSCGEAIAVDARECRYCGASALVGVRSSAAIVDGRARYQAARAVSALGPPLPAFNLVAEALKTPGSVMVRDVPLAFALRVIGALEANGGQAETFAARPPAAAQPWLRWVGAAAVVLLLAGSGWWAVKGGLQSGEGAGSAAGERLAAKIVAKVGTAGTVALLCKSQSGAGFFVAEDLVVTNAHVACGMDTEIRVRTSSGESGTGKPVHIDTHHDLALVRVSGLKGTPLPLGDAGTLEVGENLVMIGSPVGMDFTVHQASVSNVQRAMLGVAYIQIEARINPGNSGGPVLDRRGRVIGVATLKQADADGIGFAVPINYVFTAGQNTWVAPPEGAAASPGFASMLARAVKDEQETVAEATAAGEVKRIVAVRQVSATTLHVLIVRIAMQAPPPEMATFRVWAGEQEVCAPPGPVREWRVVEGGSDEVPPHVKEFLARNNLGFQVYLGAAEVRLDGCPFDTITSRPVIELLGADKEFSRAKM
jgi:serine protease Do